MLRQLSSQADAPSSVIAAVSVSGAQPRPCLLADFVTQRRIALNIIDPAPVQAASYDRPRGATAELGAAALPHRLQCPHVRKLPCRCVNMTLTLYLEPECDPTADKT